MSHEAAAAARYRLRAMHLREMAKACDDRETARTVLRVAEDYELMARVFDDFPKSGLGAMKTRNLN